MKTVRIASGASSSRDRLLPALDLLDHGNLDYICFSCLDQELAARKEQQQARALDLAGRLEKILPLANKNGVKIITDLGGTNIERALEVAGGVAKKLKIGGLSIAGVTGTDLSDRLERYEKHPALRDAKGKILSMRVIPSHNEIVRALREGADIVFTGLCAPASMYTAPLAHEFGWKTPDQLAIGALVGQLMKDGAAIVGSRAALPGKYEVPDLWNVGYPIAEIDESGGVTITKLASSGGRIDALTCTEQLLCGIGDPSSVRTPDVIADFSEVSFRSSEKGGMRASGARGSVCPDTYEVSVGCEDGYIATFEISFGGPGCYDRIALCEDILEKRARYVGYDIREWQSTVIGMNALFPSRTRDASIPFPELRLRTVARVDDRDVAHTMFYECGTLSVNGPAAGGGRVEVYRDVVNLLSAEIPKAEATCSLVWARS